MKTPDEFAEAMRGKGTYRPDGPFVPSKSGAPISSTGIWIIFGIFLFWAFLTYKGVQKLSEDKALSDPTRAGTAIADVVEFHWSHGGTATYHFLAPETGAFILNTENIGRGDYDDLAGGGAHSIEVHYLRANPHINAPALDVPGDIWMVFLGAAMSLWFGVIGCLVWRKRHKPNEG